MEPEGSFPHSQEPAISSCRDPDQSSSCHPIALLQDQSQYYPPFYDWVFQEDSLPHVFPTSSLPNVCCMVLKIVLKNWWFSEYKGIFRVGKMCVVVVELWEIVACTLQSGPTPKANVS